jgi:hypothetical protein
VAVVQDIDGIGDNEPDGQSSGGSMSGIEARTSGSAR